MHDIGYVAHAIIDMWCCRCHFYCNFTFKSFTIKTCLCVVECIAV